MTRAGIPATMVFAGISLVTTAPAATIAFLPTVTPGKMVALAPSQAFFQYERGSALPHDACGDLKDG